MRTLLKLNFGVVAALLLMAAGLAGCPVPEGQVVVTVSPPYAVVSGGETIELSAASSSATDTAFTWASSDESIARVEETTAGTATLVAVAAGTATITATADVSGVSGGAMISVPEVDSGEEPETPAFNPGLHVSVKSVTIPEDLKPVVVFEATDDEGEPVALSEFADMRFMLAYLNDDPVSPRYTSYTTNNSGQATSDGARADAAVRNADGTISLKLKTAVPANYDVSATHQVGGQFRREFFVDGQTYVANAVFAFRPDGQPVTETREISSTDVCNSCHTRISEHGDVRREYQYCIMCHQPQSVDPESGNTVDMVVMIHKIHMGKDLPSVKDGEDYVIIGHNNTPYEFSDIAFPQDVRNCTTCHRDAPGADAYLTRPTQAGCGSCHDRTWFGHPDQTPEGYENHPMDFEQPDDSMCATCHKPTAPAVSPIDAAHAIPSSKGPGLAFAVTGVTASEPVDGTVAVTVNFTATDGDGAAIADMASYYAMQGGVILAWPAPEIQNDLSETFVRSGDPSDGLVNHGGGAYSYTLSERLPVDSTTYALAMQGRLSFPVGSASVRQGLSANGYTEFTVDGSEPQARRVVVDEAGCNQCHMEIRGHGDQRLGVEVCVMCHHTNQTDIHYRDDSDEDHLIAGALTVNFKDMIHRIHTGEELNRPYTVVGHNGNTADFTEVRFPGDRRQCTICHLEDTYLLPLVDEAVSTKIDNETTVTEILPTRAACNSCHDHLFSDMHAVIMSDPAAGVETCEVCHGANKGEAVDLVHRMGP